MTVAVIVTNDSSSDSYIVTNDSCSDSYIVTNGIVAFYNAKGKNESGIQVCINLNIYGNLSINTAINRTSSELTSLPFPF